MSPPLNRTSVFHDPAGTRWRRIRRVALALGVLVALLAAGLVAGILLPPALPGLGEGLRSPRPFANAPHLLLSRSERERVAARQRLFAATETREALRGARHPGSLPLRYRPVGVRVPAQRTLVAGFFVNWDDNSFVSLKAHVAQLDWLVCEWLFLAQSGDSLRIRVDRRVLYLTQHMPAAERPSVLAMLTNYDSARADFDPALLRRLVTVPAHRAAVIGQAVEVVRTYGLAGVTVDFEEIPASLHPQVTQFVRELSAALHPLGAVVAQAVSPDIEPAPLQAYAAAADRLFLMLYDEHVGRGDAGPVASQRWYLERAQRMLGIVPPEKAILAVGAYGYEWNDAQPNAAGDERTFQDVMRSARLHGAAVRFDSLALNPYITWSDPDSTDHVVWFLDGVTAYNQMMASRTLGASGIAVWRLGAEDPSLWHVLRREGGVPAPDSLGTIQSGYDVEFDGTGELLRVESRPTTGRRELRVDHATGLVVGEHVSAYPSPYVVHRRVSSSRGAHLRRRAGR
jgi:hypothetical protein